MLKRRLENILIENAAYMVTTVTRKRQRVFAEPRSASLMTEHILNGSALLHYWLYAFVVMPDHIHLVLRPRAKNLSEGVGSLKGASSRAVNRSSGRQGTIWQGGFFSRPIVSMELLSTEVAYVEGNPARAGMVGEIGEYEFSSAFAEHAVDFSKLPAL